MSKKYIIINGIKFPNNAFFGNLNSNEFDIFQGNIWAFESRVPDWMLKQLKDNFDPSVYNQDFESFYGKWNKFDKNSLRNSIEQISVYDDGKIDLTGDLDSAGQLDSTGAAIEDPTLTIVNLNQTLDDQLTRLEQNEEIQNLGDLDSEGLNFQEIKDELDSLDSSFESNLTEVIQLLDGLGITTVINGNDITAVNYESIVDPNSTSLEDDVKALDDKWNDIPQNDIQNIIDVLEDYTSPEIPGNNLGQDLKNLQEIYAILNEEVSINDRLVEQNEKFNEFISKVELNQDLSYTNPIISSIQVGVDDSSGAELWDEIGENSSVTETIEYARRNLIDEDDTSVARLDEEGNLVGEKESFFVSNSSQSTDSGASDDGSDIQSFIELKPELNKREITYKSESGEDVIVNITGKLTYLNYDSETNQLIYTNENGEDFFAEIAGQLTSIEYREEDAKIGEYSYKKKFLDYYGEEYFESSIDRGDDTDPNNIKNPDGSWSIELPQSFRLIEPEFYDAVQLINDEDGDKQKSFPWIWTGTYKSHMTDRTMDYKVLKYKSSSDINQTVVMSSMGSNVRLTPSPNMLIANGNPDLNDPNFNFNYNVRISDWIFDWDSTIDVDNPTEDFTINWITSEEYNSKPIGGPYDLLTYPMGSGGNLNGMVYYQGMDSYISAADMKTVYADIFQAPLKPEYHHPTFLFRLDQVPLYKDGNSYQTESGVGIFDNIFRSNGAYKNLFYEYSENGQITPKTEGPTIDWDALYNTFSYFEILQDFRYDEDEKEFQKRYYIAGKDFRTSGENFLVQYIDPNNDEIKIQWLDKQNVFANLDSLLNTGIDQFDYTTTVQAFRTTESTDEILYPYTKMKPKGERSVSQEEFDRKILKFQKERLREYANVNPLNGWFSAIGLGTDERDEIDLAIDKKISDFTKNNLKVSKNIPEYIDKLHYPFKSLVFINEEDFPQIVKVRENLTSIFTPQKSSIRSSIDLAEIEKIESDINSVNGDVSKLSKTEKFDRRYIYRYKKLLTNIIGVGTEDVQTYGDGFEGLTRILNSSYYNNYQNEDDSAYSDGSWNLGKSERVMYYVNEEQRVYKINLDLINTVTQLRKTVDNDLYFIHEKVPHQEYAGLSWLFDENITTQSFEDQLNSFDWQTAADSTDIEKQNAYKPNLIKMHTVAEDYDTTFPNFLNYKSGDLAFFRLNEASKSLIKFDGISNQNVENILKVCIELPVASWFNIFPSSYKFTTTEGGLVGYEEIGVIIESLVDEEQKCSISHHISENTIDKDGWKFKADETSLDISAIVIPAKNNSIDSLIDDRVLVKGEISRHFEINDDPLLDLSSMSVERIDFEIPSVLDFQQLNSGSLNSGNDVRYRLTLENEVIANPNDAENSYKFLKIGSELKDSDYVKPSYPVKQDYKIYNNSNSEQEIDLQYRNHFIDLRTYDVEGYETGQNFKGVLGNGLYDGQEIKIWITNTGNNSTYSDFKFDFKGPFDLAHEFEHIASLAKTESGTYHSKQINYDIGERYRLPLGYRQAGRAMNDWVEDSSLGLDISARNISRFKTKFFYDQARYELDEEPGQLLEEEIQTVQTQISNDSRTVPIKGKGLAFTIKYYNYYLLKDVDINSETLSSAVNRFEDISSPRSLEKSIEQMKKENNVIGRPVIKVLNSLIPSHGVGDEERSDFFTEFPAYEDYYYRVTQPEIVKFKVTSTSKWEQDLYELSDDEHWMQNSLMQYRKYASNYPYDPENPYYKTRRHRDYNGNNNVSHFTNSYERQIPYKKGVWSGDYWRSYYTTFPTNLLGPSKFMATNLLGQPTRARTTGIYYWEGNDHVLWKYEHVSDLVTDEGEIQYNVDFREKKPISKDYYHLGTFKEYSGTEYTQWQEGLLDYPNFLTQETIKVSGDTPDGDIRVIYEPAGFYGYAAWGEDSYGSGRRTRAWENFSYSHQEYYNQETGGYIYFREYRLKKDPEVEYYFRRNRYSNPIFLDSVESLNEQKAFGENVEIENVPRYINNTILDNFKTKYYLNIPDLANVVSVIDKTTQTTKKITLKQKDGNYNSYKYCQRGYTGDRWDYGSANFSETGDFESYILDASGRASLKIIPKSLSIPGPYETLKKGNRGDRIHSKYLDYKIQSGEASEFNEGWQQGGKITYIGSSSPKKTSYGHETGTCGTKTYSFYDTEYVWTFHSFYLQADDNYVGYKNLDDENIVQYIDEFPGYTLEDGFSVSGEMKKMRSSALSTSERIPVTPPTIWNSHAFMLSGLNLDNGNANFDENGNRIDLINAYDLYHLYTGKNINTGSGHFLGAAGHDFEELPQHPWVKSDMSPIFDSVESEKNFFESLANSMNSYYSDKLPLPSYCFNFYDRRYRGMSSTLDFWYNDQYYTNNLSDHGKILNDEKYYERMVQSHHAAIDYHHIERGFVFLDRRVESKQGSIIDDRLVTSEKILDNYGTFDPEDFSRKLGADLGSISFSRIKKLIDANKDLYEPLAEASDNPNHLKDAILFHVDDNDVIICVYKPKFTHSDDQLNNYILDISEFKDNLRTGDSIILHYPKKIRPENFLEYNSLYETSNEEYKADYEEIFSRYRQGILGVNLNINYTIGNVTLPDASANPDSGKFLFDITNPDNEDIDVNAIKSYGWYSPGQNFQRCSLVNSVNTKGNHWLIGGVGTDDRMWHCGLEAGKKEFVNWRLPLYISTDEIDALDSSKVQVLDSDSDANVYKIITTAEMSPNSYEGSLSDVYPKFDSVVAFNNNVTIHQPLIKRPGTGIIVRSGGAPELFQGHQDSPFPSNNEQISDNFYFERTRKVVPETVENQQFDEDRRTKLRKMSNWQWGLFEFENTGEWVHEEVKTSECEYYSVVKPKYIDVSPLMYKCVWSKSEEAWILHGGSHSDKFTTFNN